MNKLRKPTRLRAGDTVAAISPSHGWAGDEATAWKYALGVRRLNSLGLRVVPAPNALRGHTYLSQNPQARAEDLMWAFENKDVRAIIATMGGNDSIRLIPHIDRASIIQNPKILIGYSDVMYLHMLCYHCGLSSFYGDNLLEPIAEAQGWHPYSKKWFEKVLFHDTPIGPVEPSAEWTHEKANFTVPSYRRSYIPNEGYELIQGKGIARGRLFGGHTGLLELEDTPLSLTAADFQDAVLFLEDIPEFFAPRAVGEFLERLYKIGALQVLKGILIGKINEAASFNAHKTVIKEIFSSKPSCPELPVLYGLNFGHSSPVCVLPYGANVEIDCDNRSFSILESGVV